MSKARKYLNDYTDAAREIELAGVCIDILEMLRDPVSQRCINALKKSSRRQLIKLDRAAAKLGAPYPNMEEPK